MSGVSTIEWTDVTWNPTVGCARVSAGCDKCYAFDFHDRRMYGPYIKAKREGREIKVAPQFHQPFSHVQLMPERLRDPYRWRKPRRVFVNSVSDLFHPDVPDAFILDVWLTMQANPRHTFQILTKRPERMATWCRETFAAVPSLRSLPNVWLGVSVEDQAAADERIPHLLDTPAAIHFLSCEPLLGEIDLRRWMVDWMVIHPWSDGSDFPSVDWVIAGGESGPHARRMRISAAFDLRSQCDQAGVPFFMKQVGSVLARELGLHHPHGAEWREWPSDIITALYSREWPRVEEEVTR